MPSKKERQRVISEIKKLRRTRNQHKVKKALEDLFLATKEGRNVVRPTIEAAKAYATIGEIVGVVRLAYGFEYDPFDTLEAPKFIVDALRKRR